MSKARSYKQACNIALALDLIGERWTLLIIRELILGPKRFGDLLPHLQGMGTNLLTTRLKELETHAVIEKQPCSPNSRRMQYKLTPLGEGLENVLRELIRWGIQLPQSPPSPDSLYQPEWDLVAIKLLYKREKAPKLEGTVLIKSVESSIYAIIAKDGLQLDISTTHTHDATIEGNRDSFEKLFKGKSSLNQLISQNSLKISGNTSLARKWASCFS
ncbi:winged helix-turn-helix transcriptional regulator [Puniceicoccaceae bacterium K14]|nr:winged helix-turn-helix transcriptional regulator [Puniceicoccaceae bacterium K14]